MDILKTSGKVVDSAVILGSIAVIIAASMAVVATAKEKKYGKTTVAVLTLLIGAYAAKSAVTSINK